MITRVLPRSRCINLRGTTSLSASRIFCTRSSGVSADANPEAKRETVQEPIQEKKPFTFGRFVLYATGGISAATFMYYFYQSDFNLHRTEIAISKKFAQLPFYWPPGPSDAEVNTSMPELGIPTGIADQASAWFIYQDTSLKDGVKRNDVIELFAKLGLVDSEKEGDVSFNSVGDDEFRKKITTIVQSFIEKGRGRLVEYKRLSGVSLQETISLLDDLIVSHLEINPNISESVSAKLNDILGTLVDAQEARAGVPGMALAGFAPTEERLPEVDVSDFDLLEMELSQLERSRDALKSGKLSEAEKGRLRDLEAQIAEVVGLLKNSK